MTHTNVELVCGCRCSHCGAITSYKCPLHASAADLLTALEGIVEACDPEWAMLDAARAAIKAAK